MLEVHMHCKDSHVIKQLVAMHTLMCLEPLYEKNHYQPSIWQGQSLQAVEKKNSPNNML